MTREYGMSSHTDGPGAGRKRPDDDRIVPTQWQTRVLSTAGVPQRAPQEADRLSESVDEQSGFPMVQAPGLHVVVLDLVSQETVQSRIDEATRVLERVMTHPLDLGAIALPNSQAVPNDVVAAMARRRILVVEEEAENPYARAVKFAENVLAQRIEGLAQVHRYAATIAQRTSNRDTDPERPPQERGLRFR